MRTDLLTLDCWNMSGVARHHIVNLEPGFIGGDDDAASIQREGRSMDGESLEGYRLDFGVLNAVHLV